ncbi:hypothetical protein GCM10012275_31040 [Longimycelium tulufanense]|uniref:Uncharacterized protein n=1 Tax=Longimycelium tulufanense TaxID=907463 RepID=A0A8J3FUD3_9PSEU|nr:hypothetical protein [Longimycelium tulufanense]GGM57643.1 hypothetical protein GCM10012275_31040 [Longimycelium tulufanense]
MSAPDAAARNARAQQVEERLASPVLVAAAASVPAVFLTALEGIAALIGTVLNWASLAVLIGESLLLLLLSGDLAAWVRKHRWKLLVAGATVPAVLFAVGPVQVLRLMLALGTLRVLQARRILRAGHIIRRKAGLGARWGRWVLGGATVLAAVFVVTVLANPESQSRRLAMRLIEKFGVVPLIAAGVLVLTGVAAVLFGRCDVRARRLAQKVFRRQPKCDVHENS